MKIVFHPAINVSIFTLIKHLPTHVYFSTLSHKNNIKGEANLQHYIRCHTLPLHPCHSASMPPPLFGSLSENKQDHNSIKDLAPWIHGCFATPVPNLMRLPTRWTVLYIANCFWCRHTSHTISSNIVDTNKYKEEDKRTTSNKSVWPECKAPY